MSIRLDQTSKLESLLFFALPYIQLDSHSDSTQVPLHIHRYHLPKPAMTTLSANHQTANAFFAALESRDVSRISDLLSEDFKF